MAQNEVNNSINTNTIIISILVVIIVILGFFLGKKSGTTTPTNTPVENNEINKNNSSNSGTTVENTKDITMTVIDDIRCKNCNTKVILEQLKMVPALNNVTIIEKDFADDGVKEYLKENEIKAIPAIIFNTNNIEKTMNEYLKELPSKEYSLALGSSFDPYAEICDNNIDDTNNGKIDCDDTTCSSKPICRNEEKAKLEVFLMGFCPFGEIAAKEIPKLQETFGDKINIDIHFIATKTKETDTAEAFDSLHGVTEAEEDIRQLCIKRDYGVNKLISYFTERYKNADNYGKVTEEASVAYEATGIDGKKIEECIANGEGGKLLEEDIKLAEELKVSGSPTWFANNKYSFGGIEAGAITKEFCKYNTELEACNNLPETSSNEAKPTDGNAPACN